MKLLVVEDDPTIAEPLCTGLVREGFDVTHVASGRDAVRSAATDPPDLILLDLGLPDLDGRAVCREIRSTSTVPVIVVTARSDEIDRVSLLELGADDYVVKPFGFRELVARIGAVLRRTAAGVADTVEAGRHRVAAHRRSHAPGSRETASRSRLTPKEFDLVAFLATDPGAVRTREDIIRNVWDENWWGSTKTLDVHVASLRKKLGSGCDPHRARRRVQPGRSGCGTVTRRLVLSYLAVTIVVLALFEIPLAVFFQQREEDRLTIDVERDATVLATIYEDALEQGTDADPIPAQDYFDDTGVRTVVVDADGISVVDTGQRRGPGLLDPTRDHDGADRATHDRDPLLGHARHRAVVRRRAGCIGWGGARRAAPHRRHP